jgi:putative ABC transport system permease protein
MSEGNATAVRKPAGIIVDQYEDAKLESPRMGDVREIGGHRARIVGRSRGIVGFMVNPYVFTTFDQALLYLGRRPEMCSYFLVKLTPDADPAAVCQAIQQRVPEVDAYPRNEYAHRSVNYWMTRTGLGISFGAATLLGLLVGLIIVSQTLYSSILDRLGEYSALKAMGAKERQLYGVLFLQSSMVALAGSVLGLYVVMLVQSIFNSPHAPIVIPWRLSLGSCALVYVICLVSSLLPYLRIRRVDPILVLQS